MPFALGFQIYPWLEHLLRVQAEYPLAAYGLALLIVVLAALVRGLVGSYAGAQIFITFYPAIIIAALVGGSGTSVLQLFCLPLQHGTSLSRTFCSPRPA